MLVTITTLAALTIPAQDCHQPTAGFGSYGVTQGANGGSVSAMAVYDDGHGPALYVAGEFEVAGEIQAGSIARFDGSTWEALPGPGGASVASDYGFGIQAMEVFDDGSGPALYVAGSFEESLGLPPNGIARWDGATWTRVVEVSTQYGGFFGVTDMLVWNDGRTQVFDAEALRQSYSSMLSEELLAIVSTDAHEYEIEAVGIARAELRERGIDDSQIEEKVRDLKVRRYDELMTAARHDEVKCSRWMFWVCLIEGGLFS